MEVASERKFNTPINRPTKMVRIISTSPLCRIFHPYKSIEKYLENPDLVYTEKEPWEIMIETSTTTHLFKPEVPYLIDESIAFALIGIDNKRTTDHEASSGLVYFNVSRDVESALEYTKQTGERLPARINAKLEEEMKVIREASHKRVLDHCKKLYNSLIAGRNQLKEAGKNPQEPNDMELLISFILRDEVKKAKAKRSKLTLAFNETASEIGEDVATFL